MKLSIQNLGKIQQANIELKDLTIICGPNSSNKTWLSYLISNILETNYSLAGGGNYSDFIEEMAEAFRENGTVEISIKDAKRELKSRLEYVLEESRQKLHQYFNVEKSALDKLNISLDMSVIDMSSVSEHNWTTDNGIKCYTSKNSVTLTKTDEFVGSDDLVALKNNLIITFFVFISSDFANFKYDKPYLATSERTGALVFQKDLDRTSVALDTMLSSINKLDLDAKDKNELIQNVASKIYTSDSRVSTPVQNNVKDIRNSESYMTKVSHIANTCPDVIALLDELNGGKFVFKKDDIRYVSNDVIDDSQDEIGHKIGSASSSIKSLFLIDLYIRHLLSFNDALLIDEPELNLHPNNQRLMARLIVRLVNAGVKVVITTHSDYLIREISNAVTLSNDFDDKSDILEKYNLTTSDILSKEKISAYSVNSNGNVKAMGVTSLGIETQLFDKLINESNELQDQILYKVAPELFEDE